MRDFLLGGVLLALLALTGCSQSSSNPVPAPLLPAEQPTTSPGEQPTALPATTPTPQTDPPVCNEPQVQIFSPAETNADYSKRMINAQAAYDLGLTGRCVSVGVIDTGLTSVPHPELPRDRIDIYPRRAPEAPQRYFDINTLWPDTPHHGTAVAGVVAAAADGVGMHGVAPGARVWSYQIQGMPDVPGWWRSVADLFAALQRADSDLRYRYRLAMVGVDILNMSWTWPDTPVDHRTGGQYHYSEARLRQHLPLSLAQFIQADTDEDERTIFVWAAGNESRYSSPSLPNGLSAHIAELRGHWLIVTSVDSSGALAYSTTPCGITRDNCLAAPGACILAPTVQWAPGGRAYQWPNNNGEWACVDYSLYHGLYGTSFAAPMVSGALALMIERFRGQLGNTAIVQRVLATANKRGRYSNSAIYGQGLLDIGAAVRPVGRRSLLLSGRSVALDGLRQGLVDTSGLLSLLGNALQGVELMVRDELGAPFWYDFAQLPGAVARPFDDRWSQLLPLEIEQRLGRGDWKQRMVRHSSVGARTEAGYALDGRSSDSSGVFVGAGMQPGWLMGVYADGGLRIGDFGGHRAFVAPALQQVSAEAVGGGVTLDLGGVSWSAALFRGRSVGDIDASGEENSLLMAEYRRDGRRGFWLLQAGVVQEPGSWLGVQSEGSIYGGFGARTGYLNLMGLWAPFSSWQLLGSWYRSGTELQPLAAGLLVSVSQVQSDQLELGVLKRSVLRAGDALGLRWVGSVQRAEGVSWHLPIGLYRRQVQYADPVQDLKSGLQQRGEMLYGMSLGRGSRLWLRLGQDRGLSSLPSEGYAAISLTLDL